MALSQKKSVTMLPVESLQRRLALALDEASTAARLYDLTATELQIEGLTEAEINLIDTWLVDSHRWLRDCHETMTGQPVLKPFVSTGVCCIHCHRCIPAGDLVVGCDRCQVMTPVTPP